MILFVAVRTVTLVTRTDPLYMSIIEIEENMIDLWQLGFMFAIQDVPPQVGKLQAFHVSWPNGSE